MNCRAQFYIISSIIFMTILLLMLIEYPIFYTYIVEEDSFTRAQMIQSIFLECIAYSSRKSITCGGPIQRYINEYIHRINKYLVNLSNFYGVELNVSNIVFEGGLDEGYYKIYCIDNPKLYYMVSWNYCLGSPSKYVTINPVGEAEYKYNLTLEYRHSSSLLEIVQPNITIYTLSLYRIRDVVVRKTGFSSYIVSWPTEYEKIVVLDSYGVMILIDVGGLNG